MDNLTSTSEFRSQGVITRSGDGLATVYDIVFPGQLETNSGIVLFDSFHFYRTTAEISNDIIVNGLGVEIVGYVGNPNVPLLFVSPSDNPPRDFSYLANSDNRFDLSGQRFGRPQTSLFTIDDGVKGIRYRFTGVGPLAELELVSASAEAVITVNTSNGQSLAAEDGIGSEQLPSNQSAASGSPILTMISGINRKYCYPSSRIRSPIITIEALSAARNTNFGEVFISIEDIRPYSGTFDGEYIRLGDRSFLSRFCKFPQFNYVLKGKGVNLLSKFKSLISHYNLDIDIRTFQGNMALYSYSKYALSAFLYGYFSLEHLLRQNNLKFLRDLRSSRFSEFSAIFENPRYGVVDYYRFFRREIKIPDERVRFIDDC